MSDPQAQLEEEVLRLYREPIVGANYANTYGEENLVNLVRKYNSLSAEDREFMKGLVAGYAQSEDLACSYVSVAVLHALDMHEQVQQAYQWAASQDNPQHITSHFDIGKSLAEHFLKS